MKLFLDREEVWPVYALFTLHYSTVPMVEVELSEPDYADYKAACAAYEEWQSKLMLLWKAKEKRDE